MIVQRLVELASRDGLGADPAFVPEPVHWLLVVAGASAQPQLVRAGEKKGKLYQVPKVGNRNNKDSLKPKLLVDDLGYVLGATKDGGEAGDMDKAHRHHAAFRDLARTAAESTGDVGARAAVEFMDALAADPKLMPSWKAAGVKPDNRVAFAYDYGDEGLAPVFDREAVRAFWRGWYAERAASDVEAASVCLCCGAEGPVVTSHSIKVKGVPGTAGPGAPLVSSDKAAFESYGFASSVNGPMCAACADRAALALGELLRRAGSHMHIRDTGTFCWWTRAPGEDDFLSLLDQPTEEEVERLLTAPWRGRGGEATVPNAFYALHLSGNSGRLVVRDWIESTVPRAKEYVRRWFHDLSIVPIREGRAHRPPGIPDLVRAVGRPAARGVEVSPRLPARLFRAAIAGEQLPDGVLVDVLQRLRVEGTEWNAQRRTEGLSPRRAGLIRACLRRMPGGKGEQMTTGLDETRGEPAYLCGRLLSVLARIQDDAIPGAGATVIDRFYGTASSAPGVVLPRLVRLSQNHLGKLRSSGKKGLAVVREKSLGEIMSGLPEFPDLLTLEEQGLFALGYYHQRARSFEKVTKDEGAQAGR